MCRWLWSVFRMCDGVTFFPIDVSSATSVTWRQIVVREMSIVPCFWKCLLSSPITSRSPKGTIWFPKSNLRDYCLLSVSTDWIRISSCCCPSRFERRCTNPSARMPMCSNVLIISSCSSLNHGVFLIQNLPVALVSSQPCWNTYEKTISNCACRYSKRASDRSEPFSGPLSTEIQIS